MDEKKVEVRKEENQFINEKIVMSGKVKRKLRQAGWITLCAVLFGVIARIVFVTSDGTVRKVFGIEEPKTQVEIGKGDGESKYLKENTEVSQNPGADDKDDENDADKDEKRVESALDVYLLLNEKIEKTTSEISKMIVPVCAFSENRDFFDEDVETKIGETTGLLIGKDTSDFMLLVDMNDMDLTMDIEVVIAGINYEAYVRATDPEYGIAVVCVPLTEVPYEVRSTLKVAKIEEKGKIHIGESVIMVGAPNGLPGSVEIGMVTGFTDGVSVTDGTVASFTTNVLDYENAHGFVADLDGNVLGMITHVMKPDGTERIQTDVELDSLIAMMRKLANNGACGMIGIKGKDVTPEMARELHVNNGVYVTNVISSSVTVMENVKKGDVIVRIGNNDITCMDDFSKAVFNAVPGTEIAITLYRDGRVKNIEGISVQLR